MDAQNSEGLTCSSTTSRLSPRLETEAGNALVDAWLLRFAMNASQPLDPALLALWRDQFSHVKPEMLERACQAVIATLTFKCIPVVGEIHQKLADLRHEEEIEIHRQWLSNQPSDEELHRRGVEYCSRMRDWTCELVSLRNAAQPKIEAELIVIGPEQIAKWEADKKVVLARFGGGAAA